MLEASIGRSSGCLQHVGQEASHFWDCMPLLFCSRVNNGLHMIHHMPWVRMLWCGGLHGLDPAVTITAFRMASCQILPYRSNPCHPLWHALGSLKVVISSTVVFGMSGCAYGVYVLLHRWYLEVAGQF